MKTKKLLAKLTDFMNKDQTTQREELEHIRKVLKKLKKKEQDLREELAAELDDDERRELEGKLDVVHAQRIKGVERVKEIRDRRRENGAGKVSEM